MSLEIFTNLYSLLKTLRFGLKPVDENGTVVPDVAVYIKEIKEKDEKIKAAYQALKPVLDDVHEGIINDSLNSTIVKEIDFSEYLEEYRKKGAKKRLDGYEKVLRQSIGMAFQETIHEFNKKSKPNKKGSIKPLFKIKDKKIVAKAEILYYLKEQYINDTELRKHIKEVEKFFTYFDNYNTNRANYYEYKKEAGTAVASRVVSDNLPKFCDNILLFERRQQDYENVYQFLKDNNLITQNKNAENGQMVEAIPVTAIFFEIGYFKNCLTQIGIEEYNKAIGHYNLLINLYNQARRNENGFSKLKHFKTLYKQIGCGKSKALFFQLKYDTQEEQDREEPTKKSEILNLKKLLEKIKEKGSTFTENVDEFINWLQEHKRQVNWNGIYWSKSAVNKISNMYLENWHALKDLLKTNSACVHKNNQTKEWEFNDAVELSGLFGLNLEFKDILKEEHNDKLNLIDLICDDIKQNINGFNEKLDSILTIRDYKDDNNKEKIGHCLDLILNVIRLIKYFSVKENKIKGEPIDSDLSNHLSCLLKNDDFAIIKWYDAIHSYLTQKPQDGIKNQKLKLNFGKGMLLEGFVDSHTDSDNGTQYGGYIFRKKNANNEYEYFLGISKDAKLFRCHEKNNIKDEDKSEYERLDYYQAKSTTYFDDRYSKNKVNLINKIEELVDGIPNNETEKKIIKKMTNDMEITPTALFSRLGKSEIKEFKDILQNTDITEIVNNTINQLQKHCEKFEDSSNKLKSLVKDQYIGIDGLKQIISDLQGIAKENKIYDFFCINKNELKKSLQQENRLYLFKITNRDLKERDLTYIRKNYKGQNLNYNDNLHTLYFKALMREINNFRIDIGKGEIFYRESLQGEKVIHDANQPIDRRSDKKKESIFDHSIVKDNRFYEDTLQLHLSININYNPSNKNVDDVVNDYFSKNNDVLFLGIDRGEKNLIYYSLINQNSEILEQGHFNIINNKDYYTAILKKTEEKKVAQQRLRKAVEIKNIKDGYISLVVHEIVKKIKDKPTFIVLEDLNRNFKRSRFFREHQVYQKFETALAKKLNYLVYKDAKYGEVGSVINGLQLTPLVNNPEDIDRKTQLGIMLYVRADYTSITDPVTGWRKTIYLEKGSEAKIKEQILATFSDIGVDGQDYFFEYTDKNANRQWRLWSSKNGIRLERYRSKRGNDKNEFIIQSFNVKEMLDELFKGFDKTISLREQLQIKAPVKIDGCTAWESLRFVIDLIMQIRNNGDKNKNQDENFLLSPVRNENSEHFDSRNYQNQKSSQFPKDADANGAFNIARKGLIVFEHIKQNPNPQERDLFVKDEEWDLWLSNRNEWKKRLPEFSTRKQNKKVVED